ncbi:MAG TPA: ATP-binding protein [Thermoanaerobaculia bacterium]|nr:ATP-binding protein [Thermoanaerobaculia bacterium]
MPDDPQGSFVVRGTEILPTDPPRLRRQKLARITLDSMVQFVGLLDAEGTVLEINKVALDAVGIELSEVEGKPFWTTFWWQVSEEINATLRESIARAAQGEFVRWDTPIYGRAGGKETIIIDASLMPVTDDDGKVVFIAAEGRDITEKKAHEREIAQKNIELQGLLERIRELDEIKTQFFANVSHELRTPLALILGPAQRLIDDDGTMDLMQRREAAQVVARNARMLLKHVNDLLDMSKLEAGKLKIELADTDVAALVRFLASHFGVLAAERRIDYAVEANEPCLTAVDPDKLQRVVMNLLANAFKFVPDGGRVRCTVRQSAHGLTIAVDDSGPGVKPELRTAIFERFRQGDGGTNRKVGGTGLGLAIAKEFVEMHKGRIEVLDSDLGGARFEVTMPLHRVAPGAAQPMAPPEAHLDRTLLDGLIEELRPSAATRQIEEAVVSGVTGKPRVLVVEDNADMNRFVAQCLSSRYEVISAFDGREGLEKALRFRPALVVSDVMMPNVSGAEMIAEMRQQPELRLTPVLLLSAKADEELMVKLLDDGAQDFIVKPFSEKDLLVRVRNLILAVQAREQVEGLREAAESANRAKDEFLAMLGHELRNPLSPILTALQLMKLQGPEGSERARSIIERQVNHLTRLVDDLLDVSRITRGKVELRTEVVEMAEVVAKAIEMASPLLEQRSHTLTVDVPTRGLLVDGDPMRLSQVVSNLLTNAAKYTPPGGHVTVRAEPDGGEVVLRVRDTGMGIAPEVLPRVFDLFVQERQAIDRSQGGLGLGLTIVRNLVERHGGSVLARSEGLGRGSEIVVRLPRAARSLELDDPLAAPASVSEAKAGRDGAPRILVVDDNEDAAEMLVEALTRKGYETRVAYDAPAALRLAAAFSPDVAFLDIGLPVMDGYELASHLRNIPGLSGLRLIAVTGYGQESDLRKTREAGFHHHLVKPVDVADIEAAVTARD